MIHHLLAALSLSLSPLPSADPSVDVVSVVETEPEVNYGSVIGGAALLAGSAAVGSVVGAGAGAGAMYGICLTIECPVTNPDNEIAGVDPVFYGMGAMTGAMVGGASASMIGALIGRFALP